MVSTIPSGNDSTKDRACMLPCRHNTKQWRYKTKKKNAKRSIPLSQLLISLYFYPPPTHILRNPPNIISLSDLRRSRAVIAPKSMNIK